MDLEKILVIGNAPNPSGNNIAENFAKETSFQGQISNFFLYPFEITAQESEKVPRISNWGLKSGPKMRKTSLIKGVFDLKGKKSEFDPEYLTENSLLNLNAFVKMTRLNVHKEIHWASNSYIQAPNQKKRFNLFSSNFLLEIFILILIDKEPVMIVTKLQIKSKGVFYLEKSKFEDVFFSVGDIDVFLLCIDLLSHFKINLPSQKAAVVHLICQIIEVIKLLTSHAYKEDVLRFFLNNGAYVLAQLLNHVKIRCNKTY